MTTINYRICIVAALLLIVTSALSKERYAGTAIIRVNDSEYTIPIECDDPSRPEHGFSTEPARITREATGQTSGVRLTLRSWKETSDLVVSLDQYVAWVPSQSSNGGVLKMTLDMSPSSVLKEGMPVALTYDMWQAGERPAGIEDVSFEARCDSRDAAAPAFRKIPD